MRKFIPYPSMSIDTRDGGVHCTFTEEGLNILTPVTYRGKRYSIEGKLSLREFGGKHRWVVSHIYLLDSRTKRAVSQVIIENITRWSHDEAGNIRDEILQHLKDAEIIYLNNTLRRIEEDLPKLQSQVKSLEDLHVSLSSRLVDSIAQNPGSVAQLAAGI